MRLPPRYCAASSSQGQLILPETLKLLPLYALALTKSTGLRSDGVRALLAHNRTRTYDHCCRAASCISLMSLRPP